jgi:general secretion pathway protein G
MRSFRVSGETGFSLMELLVVLAIMGLLAAIVTPKVMGTLGKAKTQTTGTQIDQLGAALDFFKVDNGRYPTREEGLKALIDAPSGLASWNGPYLAKPDLPQDAWSRAFHYESDGEGYDLYSFGADGREGGTGGDADIGRLPKT